MDELSQCRQLIQAGHADQALERLAQYVRTAQPHADEAYYMMGNAYRKKGDWQLALNHYLKAKAINPRSPAAEAYDMVMQILEFYNKDMYNQ